MKMQARGGWLARTVGDVDAVRLSALRSLSSDGVGVGCQGESASGYRLGTHANGFPGHRLSVRARSRHDVREPYALRGRSQRASAAGRLTRTGDGFAVEVDGHRRHVDPARIDAHTLSLLVGEVMPEGDSRPGLQGRCASHEVAIWRSLASGALSVHVGTSPVAVVLNGRGVRRPMAAMRRRPWRRTARWRLVASMPGKVIRVLVAVGDAVKRRQPLVVVEAMKMENELRAGRDGHVAAIHVREGASVEAARCYRAEIVPVNFLNTLRHHKAYRYGSRALGVAAAILAVSVVTTVTVDLGPLVRQRAETLGRNTWKRPIHIGRLSIRLLTGRIQVENFSIEGLRPDDRPFFTARRLDVSLDWSTAFNREITITAVDMTDWEMLVEKWDDRNNFPKFTDDARPAARSETLHDDD